MNTHPHYSVETWRRFRTPRHAGILRGAGVASAEARTPASSAVLRLQLKFDRARIQSARFQALGCPSTIAAGDWLCEWLEKRKLDEAGDFQADQLVKALELVAERRHCAVLAEDALRTALEQR